jgi:hypothetical protein
MHFLWTAGLRSSPSSRFLLLKRLQSTQTTSPNAKKLFTYGKGGHYYLDRIDPNESVSISHIINNILKHLCCIEILKSIDC